MCAVLCDSVSRTATRPPDAMQAGGRPHPIAQASGPDARASKAAVSGTLSTWPPARFRRPDDIRSSKRLLRKGTCFSRSPAGESASTGRVGRRMKTAVVGLDPAIPAFYPLER
jgi:hypothetical protein